MPLKRESRNLKTSRIKFRGFRRKRGRAGVRNDLWVIPTTGCLDGPLRSLIASYSKQYWIDSVKPLLHGFGCSQSGGRNGIWDAEKLLVSLALNPNAAGVLVVGMGCEDFPSSELMEGIESEAEEGAVRFVSYRGSSETEILTELDRLGAGAPRTREVFPLSDLCVGVFARTGSCDVPGEPDGSADVFSDWLTRNGGTFVRSIAHGESWRMGSLGYGDRIKSTGGIRAAVAPAGAVAACTSLAANGAQIVICESDAPIPLGGPVPTIRLISSSTSRPVRSEWTDFDASGGAEKSDPEKRSLPDLVLAIAEGERTAAERKGIFDIVIDSGGQWSFNA